MLFVHKVTMIISIKINRPAAGWSIIRNVLRALKTQVWTLTNQQKFSLNEQERNTHHKSSLHTKTWIWRCIWVLYKNSFFACLEILLHCLECWNLSRQCWKQPTTCAFWIRQNGLVLGRTRNTTRPRSQRLSLAWCSHFSVLWYTSGLLNSLWIKHNLTWGWTASNLQAHRFEKDHKKQVPFQVQLINSEQMLTPYANYKYTNFSFNLTCHVYVYIYKKDVT